MHTTSIYSFRKFVRLLSPRNYSNNDTQMRERCAFEETTHINQYIRL